jgi:serine/threonine-protein kinase
MRIMADVPPTEKAIADPPVDAGKGVRLAIDGSGNRFEIFERVGSGGIGEVYRAREVRLDRIVALKSLTSTGPEAAERLLREARHQARVDHPYVCKVYGFGDLDGRPYLALQFCEGGSLAQRYRELGRSERIRLLQRVALAVDAAHQIGLIHRDLKPSNILLEKEPSGGVIPLVADFGIARAVDAVATHTGSVVGTPAYMSPEQAEGRRAIDHRTDIFSLGVTLYELVCERRPFANETANVVLDIIQREPASPRSLDPSISRDLEAIIQRCLEKEPARRYPSARALADDLDRYLRGEMVVARPQTAAYRLLRWARRRQGYVMLGLAALVGIAAMTFVAVRSRMEAAERSRVAGRMAGALERIDSGMRVAYLLPEHDIDVDRRRLAGELDEARRLVDEASGEAASAGRVILGRALLVLDQPDAARRELERAGATSPEANVALGETLLALYRREVVELDSLGGEPRKARAAELRKAYLEPAAVALARADPGKSALVAAQLAIAEGRTDDALSIARALLDADPWRYEAHVLAGRVLHDRVRQRLSGGCDEARRARDDATREFRLAREIARSLPAAHGGECATASLAAELANANCDGFDPLSAVDGAERDCERARRIDSRSEEPLRQLASAEISATYAMVTAGKDAMPMVRRSLDVIARARAAYPEAVWPLAVEGNALNVQGDIQFWAGHDPRESLDRGSAALREVVRRRPTSGAFSILSNVYKTKGDYLAKIGEDPSQAYEDGIVAAERAAALGPMYHQPFAALGNLCANRGNYDLERGGDPSVWFARAQRAYERELELRPRDAEGYNGIGIVAWGQGVYLAGSGGDPSASYEASVAAYRKAWELRPDHFLLPYNVAEALRYLASYRIAKGVDATPLLDEARRLLDDVRKRKPSNLPDIEEEAAALELAFARAVPSEAPSRAAAVRKLLRPIEVNPRRMALKAIAAGYEARAGAKPPADEVRALRAWAKGASGPEANIVDAALDLAEGRDARAALEENARRSVFLRDEIRPLLGR